MLRQHHFVQVTVLTMTLTAFGSPVDAQPTSLSIEAYTHANVMHRQIPATPPVVIPIPTTTSSYDYWWPYPPASASTTTMAPSAQSTFVQTSSSLSTIMSSSVTSNSSASSSSSLQPSSNTTASSNALPTTQTALHPTHPKFKLYYLYPIFGVIGILVIALAAWIIYGCCTRKPRTRDRSDTNSMLGGPRYIAVDEKVLRDVESGDVDAMREHQRRLELRNREDGQFRWPSYELCEHWNGQGREKDPFLRPPLPTAKTGLSRTPKSTRTSNSKSTRKSRSTRTSTSTRTGAKPTRTQERNNLLSPRSDATSLAFLELYSSDEESEEKAKEIPWESLRHKSIKRGILEQVHKDGSWRDSVRAVAGSAFADKKRGGIGGGVGNLERPNAMSRRSTGDTSSSLPSEAGGASTTRATSTRTTTTYDEGEGRWLKGAGFRMITESPAPNPPTLLNAFGYGQDDVKSEDDDEDGDDDRFTPMPTRLGQSQSRSNSRSSSPVKSTPSPIKPTNITIVRANLGGTTPSVGRQFVHPRDVLPKSPPQIMSPPLESQLCFTPTAAATARMQKNLSAPKRATSKSSDGRTKLRSPYPPPLPIPKGLGGHTARTLVKRPPPSPPVGKEKELPIRPDSAEGETKETLEEAMRTVEKIVEASWSARDLGRQRAGTLSPTGFGSRA